MRCEYKYNLEDNIKGTKFALYNKKSKKDLITLILIFVGIVMLIGLLVYDIVCKQTVLWDIILLVGFLAMLVFELLMPKIVIVTQKKYFEKSGLSTVDNCIVEINKNQVIQIFEKDGKELARDVHSISNLSRVDEDDENFYMLFGKAFAIVAKRSGMTEQDYSKMKEIMYAQLASKKIKK